MQWHKRTIIVQKLTLVVELWAFCLPISANAWAHDPTVIGSVALRKGPRRLCPHRSDHCRALMLTYPCGNAVNAVKMFGLCLGHHGSINLTAWSSRGMCVNWNELSASRLQLHEQLSALNDAWVWTGGCKRRYPKGRSRTCYQECSCHLYDNTKISWNFKNGKLRSLYYSTLCVSWPTRLL